MNNPIKLTNKDIPAVLKYISSEPEMNLFIEGDIQAYGLESEVATLYAFGQDWDCLLLRYYSNYMITSNKESFDTKPVAEYLKDKNIQCISAKETLLEQMTSYYPALTLQGTYMCRLQKKDFKAVKAEGISPKQLDASNAQDIIDLYKQIEEFAKPYIEREEEKLKQTKDNYEKGLQGYGIFDDSKLICTGYTTAQTTTGAMIVGVATHPDYRKKGYASLLMRHLCGECFNTGLSFLCLFYDNPSAGAIYHSLGFETIGRWGMLKF